jgi:hypothetical protein
VTLSLQKIAVAMLCAVSVCAGAAEPAEYQIKAEFIERFTRFVEWPQTAQLAPGQPFVIGVIGRDPFGPYLEAIARDRTIKGQQVRISRVSSLDSIGSCRILFVASSEKGRIPEIVVHAREHPVLTIADSPGALASGVMINLYTAENRVRFEINEKELQRAGFQASAQLLKLARASSAGDR